MSRAISFRKENVIRLRYGLSVNEVGVWINDTQINSVVSFALRQEVDGLWVDLTAIWGEVRILEPDADVHMEPYAVSGHAFESTRPYSTSVVSAVRYAPGEYIPASPIATDYTAPWLQTRFAVKIDPPAMRLEIQGNVGQMIGTLVEAPA